MLVPSEDNLLQPCVVEPPSDACRRRPRTATCLSMQTATATGGIFNMVHVRGANIHQLTESDRNLATCEVSQVTATHGYSTVKSTLCGLLLAGDLSPIAA